MSKLSKNGKMKKYNWSMKKFQFKARDDKNQIKLTDEEEEEKKNE